MELLQDLYHEYKCLQRRHELAAENLVKPKNFAKRVFHARLAAQYGERAHRVLERMEMEAYA